MNTRFLFGLLTLGALATTTVTRADEKAACLEAASKGQEVRDAHKLVEARDEFRVCAAAGCPSVVQTDCASWLADVESALPTVVVYAKSGAGADLVDVKVTMDGQPFAMKLDGQAVAVDPGSHAFHFEAADGTVLEETVVVREGEKRRSVAAVIRAPPAPTPPTGTEPPPKPSPARTAGWIVGGVGIAGIAVGAVFGIVAMGDKNNAHCTNDVCDPGTVSGIKNAALASTLGFVGGGVLVAGGAALVLFAPHGTRAGPPSAIRLAPVVAPGGGGAVLGGRF